MSRSLLATVALASITGAALAQMSSEFPIGCPSTDSSAPPVSSLAVVNMTIDSRWRSIVRRYHAILRVFSEIVIPEPLPVIFSIGAVGAGEPV